MTAAAVALVNIQAWTVEMVYITSGPEFGKWNGELLIIETILWSKIHQFMWHQKFSDNLRNMGLKQCKADHDLWMRDCTDLLWV